MPRHLTSVGWPSFSFCEALRPEIGWSLDRAVLATYSADLTAIVTALLAMSGCDLDHRRTGSRVEVVRAIEKLRDRVRVLVHPNRMTLPRAGQPIVGLLDQLIRQVHPRDIHSSWHPKVALLRFSLATGKTATETQWRLWIGSRNLTRSLNWETGAVLVSRPDKLGKRVEGIADLGASLALRARLADFSPETVSNELKTLTWECPPGTEFESIRLLGEAQENSFPAPVSDADRVILISPFLDGKVVRQVARWGATAVRRTLLSTWGELNRLHRDDPDVYAGFHEVLWCERPELPGEGSGTTGETGSLEVAESEDVPPTGLHAKIIYAAKGARQRLWIGSANATSRAWSGRNYEVVADVRLTRSEPIAALENFVKSCQCFEPVANLADDDSDEIELEKARDLFACEWTPTQRLHGDRSSVVSQNAPPLQNFEIQMEVATLGQAWVSWPPGAKELTLPRLRPWQQTDLIQVRLTLRDRTCEWVQLAPFHPAIEQGRDRAVIGQYLDSASYFLWLRSLLSGIPREGGGEWDQTAPIKESNSYGGEIAPSLVPTLEEILRAWARNPAAFADANEKVTSYLGELEKRAVENGATADVKMLSDFRGTWITLVEGLT